MAQWSIVLPWDAMLIRFSKYSPDDSSVHGFTFLSQLYGTLWRQDLLQALQILSAPWSVMSTYDHVCFRRSDHCMASNVFGRQITEWPVMSADDGSLNGQLCRRTTDHWMASYVGGSPWFVAMIFFYNLEVIGTSTYVVDTFRIYSNLWISLHFI